MTDINTIAELGTAVGTLFLGVATLASVRSANRAARVAERSLLLGLRPVLTPARPEDPDQEIIYGDGRTFQIPSGTGVVEEIDGVIYLAIPLRNVGAGLAVLQKYDVRTDQPLHEPHRELDRGLHDRRERRYGPIENFRLQSGTCTSPAVTPATGRQPYATTPTSCRWVSVGRSRTRPNRSRSTSSTVTTRAVSLRSAASTWSRTPRESGSAPSSSTGA
jgi:hypothetical protein